VGERLFRPSNTLDGYAIETLLKNLRRFLHDANLPNDDASVKIMIEIVKCHISPGVLVCFVSLAILSVNLLIQTPLTLINDTYD
jgi:hypothetical protein